MRERQVSRPAGAGPGCARMYESLPIATTTTKAASILPLEGETGGDNLGEEGG